MRSHAPSRLLLLGAALFLLDPAAALTCKQITPDVAGRSVAAGPLQAGDNEVACPWNLDFGLPDSTRGTFTLTPFPQSATYASGQAPDYYEIAIRPDQSDASETSCPPNPGSGLLNMSTHVSNTSFREGFTGVNDAGWTDIKRHNVPVPVKRVAVADCGVTAISTHTFAAFGQGVEELNLDDNAISDLGALGTVLSSNNYTPNLKKVTLSNNAFTNASFTTQALAPWKLLDDLVELDLGDQPSATGVVLHAGAFAGFPSLAKLDLSGVNIVLVYEGALPTTLAELGLLNTAVVTAGSKPSCPFPYYVQQTKIAGEDFYECRNCSRPAGLAEGAAFTCWTAHADSASHHSPRECSAGQYCNTVDLSETPCPRGTAQFATGSTSCTNCPQGRFNPNVGVISCVSECNPGDYGAVRGAATYLEACQQCPRGHYCPDLGTTRPFECVEGFFQNRTRAKQRSDCKACPANTYSSAAAAVSALDCTACPVTAPLSKEAATSIADCNSEPLAACSEGAGWYLPHKEDGGDDDDDDGDDVSSNAADDGCKKCPAGSYGNAKFECHLCPEGFFQGGTGRTVCEASAIAFPGLPGASQPANAARLPGPLRNFVVRRAAAQSTDLARQANVTETRLDSTTSTWGVSESVSQGAVRTVVLPVCITLAVLVLVLHRVLPGDCIRKFDCFSTANNIADTHAVRRVKTRLGGAFTYVLVITAVYLCILQATSPNTITTSSLQDISQSSEKKLGDAAIATDKRRGSTGYGRINITMELFAGNVDAGELANLCAAVVEVPDDSLHFDCVPQPVPGAAAAAAAAAAGGGSPGSSACVREMQCTAGFNIRNVHMVMFTVPAQFQAMLWSVSTDTWAYTNYQGLVVNSRYRNSIMGLMVPAEAGGYLTGTMTAPDTVKFSLTRGFATSEDNETTAGMRLEHLATDVTPAFEFLATKVHTVAFEFGVAFPMHVEATRDLLRVLDRLSIVFGLIMSVRGILVRIKRTSQGWMDRAWQMRKVKYGKGVPEDILFRQHMLNEDNIRHGVKYQRTSQLGAPAGGGTGDVENALRARGTAAASNHGITAAASEVQLVSRAPLVTL